MSTNSLFVLIILITCLKSRYVNTLNVGSIQHGLEENPENRYDVINSRTSRRLSAVPDKEHRQITFEGSPEKLGYFPNLPSEITALTCNDEIYHRKLQQQLTESVTRSSQSVFSCPGSFLLNVEGKQTDDVTVTSQCFSYKSPTDLFYVSQISVRGRADWTLGVGDCRVSNKTQCLPSCLHCSKACSNCNEDVTYYVGASKNKCYAEKQEDEDKNGNSSPSFLTQKNPIYNVLLSSTISVLILLGSYSI